MTPPDVNYPMNGSLLLPAPPPPCPAITGEVSLQDLLLKIPCPRSPMVLRLGNYKARRPADCSPTGGILGRETRFTVSRGPPQSREQPPSPGPSALYAEPWERCGERWTLGTLGVSLALIVYKQKGVPQDLPLGDYVACPLLGSHSSTFPTASSWFEPAPGLSRMAHFLHL